MPPLNDDEMLAALSSAIDGDAAKTPEVPADDAADETNTGDAGEGDAKDEGAAGEAGDEAADTGADGEQPAGDGTDKAGKTPAVADGKGTKPASTTAKADEKPADGAAGKLGPDGKPLAKEKDPINDPIPANLKEATRERMVSLVETAKALTAERDQYKSAYSDHMAYIQESRATPEQYDQALNYIRSVNSGDPAEIKKCISFMQGELKALSKLAGIPVEGVDLLADHPDLQKRVADGEISRQDAEALSAARGNAEVRNNHANATREQQAHQAIVDQGKSDLNALEIELKTRDPHFASKRAILVEALRPVFSQIDPRRWRATFQAAYNKLPNPVAPAPTPTPTPAVKKTVVGQNNPLRARQPAGGQQAAPKSALEALNQGIDGAGR